MKTEVEILIQKQHGIPIYKEIYTMPIVMHMPKHRNTHHIISIEISLIKLNKVKRKTRRSVNWDKIDF